MENRNTKKAFLWIVSIFKKHKIHFRLTGGFAARIYGCNRKLADIDIEVQKGKVKEILKEVKESIIFGPKRYKDRNWDLPLTTLKYANQIIDLCETEAIKIYDSSAKKWKKYPVKFLSFKKVKVYNILTRVITKDDLIKYKKMLGRKVDREDVKQMLKCK